MLICVTNIPKHQYIDGTDECEGSLKTDGPFILKRVVHSTIEGSQYYEAGWSKAGIVQDIYRTQSVFSACRRKGTKNRIKSHYAGYAKRT